MNSVEEIREAYNLGVLEPKIESMGNAMFSIADKNKDTHVGVHIELSVLDEFTDMIYIYVLLNKHSLKTLAGYDTYENKIEWLDKNVFYYIDYYEEYHYFIYRMKFSIDGYTYYLEAQRYDELEIPDVLNIIFNKQVVCPRFLVQYEC